MNRNLNNTFLVDNSIINFAFQIDNGIPAVPFYNDKNDQYWIKLLNYLKVLSKWENKIERNKQEFSLNKIFESDIVNFS